MAAITISDLKTNRVLDAKALSSLRGGNAGWLYGWIRTYVDPASRSGYGGVVNVYQTNYFNIADQINNQISVIDVTNSAANAVINVNAKQQAANAKLGLA